MISYYLPSESKIGVGYQVHELANELVRRGHHVDVFSACPPVAGRAVRPPARPPHRLAAHLPLRDAAATRATSQSLRRAARARRRLLDVAPPGAARTCAPCTARASRRRSTSAASRRGCGWCCSASPRCWPASSPTGPSSSRRRRGGGRRGSDVIPNGVDADALRTRRAEPRTPHPTVLFVGTWHGRKRGAELARGFSQRRACRASPTPSSGWSPRTPRPTVPDGVEVLGRLSDDGARRRVPRGRGCSASRRPTRASASRTPRRCCRACPSSRRPNPGSDYVTDDGRSGVLVA